MQTGSQSHFIFQNLLGSKEGCLHIKSQPTKGNSTLSKPDQNYNRPSLLQMLLKKTQVFIAYINIKNCATQRTDTLIGRKKHYILHTVCGIFSVIFHFNHLPTTKALGSRINSIELGHKNINTLVWASWTAVHKKISNAIKKIWTDSCIVNLTTLWSNFYKIMISEVVF